MDNNNISELSKQSNKLKGFSGFYLVGKIEGVDFTKSGTLEDGTKYGSSIKLKFAQKTTVIKRAGDQNISTTKYITQTIKLPVEDIDLYDKVIHFNKMIDKEMVIKLDIPDNASFKTVDYAEIVA